jgi:hypothetical protein
MPINWNLLNPNAPADIANSFSQGRNQEISRQDALQGQQMNAMKMQQSQQRQAMEGLKVLGPISVGLLKNPENYEQAASWLTQQFPDIAGKMPATYEEALPYIKQTASVYQQMNPTQYTMKDGQYIPTQPGQGPVIQAEGYVKPPPTGYTRTGSGGLQIDPGYQSGETSIKAAGKPQTTVINEIGDKSMTELGKEMSKGIVKMRDDASGALIGLRSLNEARTLIDSGIITGTGAEWLTQAGNLLSSRMGFKEFADPVANTQAYAATMGNQVGQIIKQFGSGTGLSDADREYAEKIVGGKITLSEPALRKLLDINEKAYKNVIKNYNKLANQAMTRPGAEGLPYDLRIQSDFGGDDKDIFSEADAIIGGQ